MRSVYLSFLYIAFSSVAVIAQSTVIGIYRDIDIPYEGYSIVAQVDPLDGAVLEQDTIWGSEVVALGSSTFDQLNGIYRFTGGSDFSLQSVELDISSGAYTSVTAPELVMNGLKQDFISGLLFGTGFVIVNDSPFDPEYETTFLSLDPATNEIDVIDTIAGLDGIVAGGTTFNPFTGLYYLIGLDSMGESAIYGIQSTTGAVVELTPLDLEPEEYMSELELDIETGMYYGIHRQGGSIFFASVDISTGQISDLLDISAEAPYYTPDAVVYHQQTGRFIMLAYSEDFQESLLTIDANTASIISQVDIDYNIIELEVDNIDFANALFVGLEEWDRPEEEAKLGLIQSGNVVQIWDYTATAAVPYRIWDMQGKLLQRGSLATDGQVNVQGLSSGQFILEWLDEQSQRQSGRFILAR